MRLNNDGWVIGAEKIISPNCSVRPVNETVSLVVIHGISLPAGVFGGDDVVRLFTNTLDCATQPSYDALRDLRVSAHFFIRRDGALVQCVSCCDVAWHAGDSAWGGRAHCNDFSIGVELEGADDVLYDDRQYATLMTLLRSLSCRYPSLKVAGHEHIAPHRKTDPGAAFDWARLFADMGEDYDGRTTV